MDCCSIRLDDWQTEALIAVSSEEQTLGLMHREPPLPNMIFPYATPRVNKFWMKSVKAPLDIVFCRNGNVISIWQGEPHSTRVLGGEEQSDLVVELPLGSCKANGISVGSLIAVAYSPATAMKILALHNGLRF